jgi:general secretion pathway protein D
MFKFLEVNQSDLDELAFNWQYARTNSNLAFGSNTGNALLRHYAATGEDAFSGSAEGGNTADATYNFAWVDSKNDLRFSVYALDWADTSDVLYSPRVTTLSGQTAKIDMSEKHYYPDEWENIDDENNENFRIEVRSAQPSLEDEQDLGVKFEIEPNVTGRQIQAKIDIPIKQFYNWLVVDTRTTSGDTTEGEFIKKPIFTNRTIRTNVTLKDGETVLIGSVTNDIVKSIHDKIPILGDIPLIGRLFQSKAKVSEKKNLLIFMTCRMINPDGSPVREREMRGLPPFRQ